MQTELLLQVVEVELSFLVEIKEEEQEAALLVPMDSVVIVQLVVGQVEEDKVGHSVKEEIQA